MIDYINQPTEDIARKLLGKILIHQTPTHSYSGYIVETEAYIGVEDMACHSYAGRRTPRLESMYKIGGTIYIYTMHTHQMLNIVTKKVGDPQAVLIRAIEPLGGIEWMERNRKTKGVTICNGPGKLTKAMEITKALDGNVINGTSLFITDGKKPLQIEESARIGIPNKEEWTSKPLRYYVKGHPFVSGMKKGEMDLKGELWK
ncbi:Putative 3-methyladenine DNA glycosylase [Bacillus sp. T2.9-1]|jgi:DNA-3-methyladenine glycosylase|nr:Putative 3-methyladenine DNA glycosylase [Bacillus sp. T2.9-1]